MKEGEKTKKGVLPLVIVCSLLVIVALVALFNWSGALGVEKTIFDTWHEKINDITINGYPLFANLLGSINPFGYWTNYELAMLLIIV